MVKLQAEAENQQWRPVGELALCFQEAFTVIARLRRNRQVASDARGFRQHMKQLLLVADRDARQAGYDAAQVRLAVYAIVAFLDESVLASPQPMFADWPRQPLQEEVFGDHRAGETFFERLREQLTGQDSADLADLLEVYLLCLLLGFKGRYATAASGELHAVAATTREKIKRIRGPAGELSPSWEPPSDETISAQRDPWIRRLVMVSAGCVAFALVLFFLYSLFLDRGVDRVIALTSGTAL
jgi:type VI secretion system protein ImpK